MAKKTGDNTGKSGSQTKGPKAQLKMPMRQVIRAVRGVSDQYLEKLTNKLIDEYRIQAQKKKEQEASHKYYEQERKDLDVIRFAFSLLRDEYPGLDFAKVNPLVVHALVRQVLTDDISAQSPQKKILDFKNRVRLLVIREMMSEKNALISRDALGTNPPITPALNSTKIRPAPSMTPRPASDELAIKKKQQEDLDLQNLNDKQKRENIKKAELALQQKRKNLRPVPPGPQAD